MAWLAALGLLIFLTCKSRKARLSPGLFISFETDHSTRRGDSQPHKNGYLVNGAGYYLMGIPVDPSTGNLVGSVPQLLQFQNDFLPALASTQFGV